MRVSTLALVAILAGVAAPVVLAEDAATPPAGAPATVMAPAAKPSGFLARLFAPKAHNPGARTIPPPGRHAEPATALAASDPIVILPEAAISAAMPTRPPEPPAVAKPKLASSSKQKPKVVAMIPVPRPRPDMPDVLAGLPIPAAAILPQPETPVDVDPVVTGSVVAAMEATTPTEAPALPPAAGEAQEEPAIDDVLPGDPSQYLSNDDLAPQPASPTSISGPARTVGTPFFADNAGPIELAEQPFELLRALQLEQDKIANGSTQALAAQRMLRAEMDGKFAAAPASTWSDRRNAEAAVSYVLSGGSPEILRKLSALEPKPAIDPDLVLGVLAYSEGREEDARRLLEKFDVMHIPPSMGAQLALAKSALVVRNDAKESMRLLSIARLLAPGTLVEEGALRRELFVADRLRDGPAVEKLARQYLQRFRRSVYAGNFRARFAAAVSRMNFVRDESGFALIDDILKPVEPEARGQLYLTIALAAVVKGNVAAAAFSSDRALSFAPSGSGEEARSQLYRAASMVADPKSFDTAAKAFDVCRRDLLGASDQALFDVVDATIDGVRSGTEASVTRPEDPELGSDLIETTPMMTKARDALKATDILVADAAQ